MFVVVVLETESDFPGVREVYGPYPRGLADLRAAELADLYRVKRGEHVQVVPIIGNYLSAC